MTGSEIRVLGICGSLRKASYNRAALHAAAELMPAGMSLSVAEIADLPLYDQDVFDAGLPEPVQRFRAEVAAADALLVAAAEYNFSMSAALKNAIDWGSRPPNQVFQDKPIAILSATTGPLGGARVQYELRRVFTSLWGHVLPRPEVFIGNAASKFDADGRLTDGATAQFLNDMLKGFEQWVRRMRPVNGPGSPGARFPRGV
jgi:chromate reductase